MQFSRLLTLTALFMCNILTAQTVEGLILDADRSPVQEALVYNTRTSEHTHSDPAGTFQLAETLLGDSLQIVMLGYEQKWVIVTSSQPLEIQLQERTFSLNEVVILPQINALHVMADMDIRLNPVNSSQDILRLVPGLVIGQHAGGGKAEQMFLRGFDLDHGTDILISADGMPVNMVSHAHGHGYADLHFLIPETIDKIDFGKGPYYGDKGNFNTAGFVDFSTKNALDNSLVKLEVGQFQQRRLLGMFNLAHTDRHKAYVASEFLSNDGLYESPQDFSRINLMGKYTGRWTQRDHMSILASHFTSQWNASGQIPQRAVDDGTITRFGAIDDTEGGQTSRTNLQLSYDRQMDDQTLIKNSIYFSRYAFELFSNFTFFLNDPVHGDQIRQHEDRDLFGFTSEVFHTFDLGSMEGTLEAGINLRYDYSHNNELSHTANRKATLERLRLGDIQETSFGGFIHPTFRFGKWTFHPGVRLDAFDFHYVDALSSTYAQNTATSLILSPKFNVLYHANPTLQFYLKTGKGFHSNDSRAAVAQNGRSSLPAAWGADLGLIWKPVSSLMIHAAIWQLDLEQEFVYVGDEGIVEPSGQTRRQGLDLSLRFQPLPWLYSYLDATYAHARSLDDPEGRNYIPLAPNLVLSGGLSIQLPNGITAGLKVCHIQDRPAVEDASLTALGYTVVDAHLGATWRNLEFGLQVQNLLNTSWNETQFATTSRLEKEMAPVEEIHFTPGTPFFLKGVISYSF
ncbi:MAG: TonB-dependent receptor [Saprospiraceae bacterium]|nr:TonB-dependent receptor [Saprospiraceae bacterium]